MINLKNATYVFKKMQIVIVKIFKNVLNPKIKIYQNISKWELFEELEELLNYQWRKKNFKD